jgi:hypothetical protein
VECHNMLDQPFESNKKGDDNVYDIIGKDG